MNATRARRTQSKPRLRRGSPQVVRARGNSDDRMGKGCVVVCSIPLKRDWRHRGGFLPRVETRGYSCLSLRDRQCRIQWLRAGSIHVYPFGMDCQERSRFIGVALSYPSGAGSEIRQGRARQQDRFQGMSSRYCLLRKRLSRVIVMLATLRNVNQGTNGQWENSPQLFLFSL